MPHDCFLGSSVTALVDCPRSHTNGKISFHGMNRFTGKGNEIGFAFSDHMAGIGINTGFLAQFSACGIAEALASIDFAARSGPQWWTVSWSESEQ